jgi:UDP:flavonoid glycosyltransferase YjiC (YdhE family)
MDIGATEVLRPELEELGLDALPEPDLWIDICPPSLRPPDALRAQMMRWIPGNRQRRLEPWMYSRSGERRVAITAGSQAANPVVRAQYCDFLRRMIDNVGRDDLDIVVAAPDEIADELRQELPGVRAGWIPLDVLAPTCDVIINHGGGVTSMTATNAGVPQLLVPLLSHTVAPSHRWSEYGAAITLATGEDTPERCAQACTELLTDPTYTERARELAREIAGLPLPFEVVGVLEKIVAG